MCRFRSQCITGTLEPKIYYIAIYLVCVCVYMQYAGCSQIPCKYFNHM